MKRTSIGKYAAPALGLLALTLAFTATHAQGPMKAKDQPQETSEAPASEAGVQIPVSAAPIQLSADQNARVADVIERTDTHRKMPKDYVPKVGAEVPGPASPLPVPAPLIEEIPVLKEYYYSKLDETILIVDPLTNKIAAIVPRQFPSDKNAKSALPLDWAAEKGRPLVGLPPEPSKTSGGGDASGSKDSKQESGSAGANASSSPEVTGDSATAQPGMSKSK